MKTETLVDIINSNPAPTPWSEGDNIPWNEPSFSERMLKEHLAQDHDAASRRSDKIKQHIAWIHEQANLGQAGRLLDLGCGPGLYASQLARLGYQVTGIDYSPASIAYAQAQAAQQGQKIRYILGDIRQAEYAADDGGAYDCAMQVYGESNVFSPSDLRKILLKIHTVIRSGGRLILEVHTYEVVKKIGQAPSSWYAAESGLFFPNPHLVLTEHFWDAPTNTATIRHFVVEAATGNVIRYAQSLQAYTNEEYISLLMESGFDEIEFIPSMSGIPDPDQEGLFVITAKRTE
ncbi:MAG: methyltransferase domain-containing protein [Anaerolineales bacterium]|jgi:SAM-dependent methyltransferase